MAEVTTNNVWFLVLALTFLPLTAALITWTAPPPLWIQTNPSDFRSVNMSLLNGSTQETLKWSYTLPAGSDPRTTRFHIIKGASDVIASIFHDSGGEPERYQIRGVNDYQTRFNISRSAAATLIINKVTEREEAVYQCELETQSGETWRYNIRVIVTVPVKLANASGDQTVREGSNVTLFCETSGRPQPNIILARVLEDGSDKVLQQGPTVAWDVLNIRRTASGAYMYRCTADNGFTSDSKVFKVNVTYPAKIVKLVSELEVASQQSVSLDCQAEGNPQPSYTWTPCDPQQSVCHENVLNFQASNRSVYTFTCKVENYLGSDTGNTTLFIASDVINVTLVITGEDYTDGEYNQLCREKLSKMIDEIFAGKLGYESVQQKNIRSSVRRLCLQLHCIGSCDRYPCCHNHCSCCLHLMASQERDFRKG